MQAIGGPFIEHEHSVGEQQELRVAGHSLGSPPACQMAHQYCNEVNFFFRLSLYIYYLLLKDFMKEN
jgi:hypothetical protein